MNNPPCQPILPSPLTGVLAAEQGIAKEAADVLAEEIAGQSTLNLTPPNPGLSPHNSILNLTLINP